MDTSVLTIYFALDNYSLLSEFGPSEQQLDKLCNLSPKLPEDKSQLKGYLPMGQVVSTCKMKLSEYHHN